MKDNDDDLVKEFEKGLKIKKHELDDELVYQPEIFYRVSHMHTRACAERDRLKAELEQTEAELAAQFRKAAEEEQKGEEKKGRITDAAIKAKVENSNRMRKIKGLYLHTKEKADRLLPLKEAYQQKSYSIRGLIDLYIANYYQSESGGKTKRDAVENKAERNRQESGKLRRERVRDGI